MSYQRNNRSGTSSKIIDLLLILGIVAGIAYMIYYHPDEVNSLKRMVGLGTPEMPDANRVSTPVQQLSLPISPPAPATTQSTNEITNPPLIGRPRPALPTQDHWTWKTTDGKTYQDVKIEKLDEDYVTIIHSTGGAHILISTLPDDLQKQLNDYSAQAQ